MNEIIKSLSEINYWEKPPEFNQGFYRSFYLDVLEKSLGNKLIKVVVGQRRSGKSYVVRQLIDLLITRKRVKPVNIFYLNKELFEFDAIASANDLKKVILLYEKKYKPKGKVYIVIDEVQSIENWEKIVVSLAQHPVKHYELIITGSNSRLLSGELAGMLSGRFIVTEVYPFNYKEYLGFLSIENNRDNFIKYITTSGLPELFQLPDEEIKRHYIESLKDTVLFKDIMQRYKIRDYVLLSDIFLFLVHNIGNLTSISLIIKYFKSKNRIADYTTISNYISFMEYAYIIHQTPRYSLKTKEILSGERKYYLNDLGFRNYLFPNLISEVGYLLENVVYMHLRMAGYSIKTGTDNNYEIDFLASKNNSSLYIQVSYLISSERTKNREFGALERIKDHYPKYLVSMDEITLNPPSGIIHKEIWQFLWELLSE